MTARLRCAAALLLAFSTLAARTQYHVVSGFAQLAEGEPESTVLTADGAVTLGAPVSKLVDSLAARVLALLAAPDGGVYVATGDPGRVLQVDRSGKVRTVFEAKEPLVTALAAAPGGKLFVATAPEGRVYRVDPVSGKAVVHFSPPGRYIWSLAADGSTLFAAGGEDGAVYRIDREGAGAPFGAVREEHVRCVAAGGKGRDRKVVAGGGSKGVVYVLQGGDGVRALFDSELEEITALVVDPAGVVYAAAVSATDEPGAADPEARADFADSGGAGEPKVREVRSSEVYRIGPDGDMRLLWKSKKDGAYTLALTDGALLIGTGGRGRLYRVGLDAGFPLSLEATIGSAEITGLVRGPKGDVLVAVNAPGALYRFGPGRRQEGVYLSKPLDARRPAMHGALRAVLSTPPSTSIGFALRLGNTETIDDTWGPFKEVTVGEASAFPLASRYVQVRATLRGTAQRSPRLTAIELAYGLGNRPPLLSEVEVLSPGVRVEPMPDDEPKGRTFSVSEGSFKDYRFVPGGPVQGREPKARARQTQEPGWHTAVWSAEDPDEDDLLFDVELIGLDNGTALALGQDLDHSFVAFESGRLPDGLYLVRVVARDSPDNTPASTLQSRLDSPPFVVDHSPPRIARLRATPAKGGFQVAFEVADLTSPLRGAWCSQDGGPWLAVAVDDGLVDEPEESFAGLIASSGSAGTKVKILRCAAEDLVGNRGLAELLIR